MANNTPSSEKPLFLRESVPVGQQQWGKETVPLVSILCAAYNHEPFIRDAIEGFLIQETTFPVEIIIHDDASTDRTPAIIRKYEARHPGLFFTICQKENQYIKRDGTIGRLMHSKKRGKYIAICEGDDFWTDPLKLQKQTDYMEEHDECSMCFHGASVIAPAHLRHKLKLFGHLEERDYTGAEILRKWTVPTASVMYRSEFATLLDTKPRHPDILYGDIIVFLTLAEQGKLHCINQKMSVYRIHEKSLTNTGDSRKQLLFIKHHLAIQNEFGGKYRHVTDPVIAGNYAAMGANMLRQMKIFIAMVYFMRSLQYDRKSLLRKISGRLFPR